MLKYWAIYLLARGLPALASLLALVFYTRLLSTAEYGRYTMVLAAAALGEAVLFHWLSLSLLRFYQRLPGRTGILFATIRKGFVAPALATIAITAAVVAAGQSWFSLKFIELCVLGALLTVALGAFNLVLAYCNARLAAVRYGLLTGLKSWLALIVGVVLVAIGFGVPGPLIGTIVAIIFSVSVLMYLSRNETAAELRKPDPALLEEIKHYGHPLAVTIALNYVIGYSDRFIIAWLLGTGETGLYAAGYDLTQQVLGALMMTINLAAVPLAIHAIEKRGLDAARGQLNEHATLLLIVSIPAALGFVVLAPNIAHVILGPEYRTTSTALMPWIAGAAFLWGMKAYYFDLAFQLGRDTRRQIYIASVVSGANICLDILLLPRVGLVGAAYAYIVSAMLACILSARIGSRIFKLPHLPKALWKFLAAAIIMTGVLWPMRNFLGTLMLCGQILVGVSSYFGVLALLGYTPRRLLSIGIRNK